MGILAGKLLDAVGGKAGRLLPVGIQRMTRQIESADLFFLLEQLGVAVLRERLDLVAVISSLRFAAHH